MSSHDHSIHPSSRQGRHGRNVIGTSIGSDHLSEILADVVPTIEIDPICVYGPDLASDQGKGWTESADSLLTNEDN